MQTLVTGIHHITALASSPQDNVDFYSGLLGLRLIKQTVNFDDPGVYHLYYGDGLGNPGTILTFFPYYGIHKGSKGYGMVNTISFSASGKALAYWENRLKKYKVPFNPVQERFNTEAAISFEDHDGTQLEIVFNDNDPRYGYTAGNIPQEFAIKGIYGAEILETGKNITSTLLTAQMEHQEIARDGNRVRYATESKPGHYIDLVHLPQAGHGKSGAGTVHHIAFGTPDENTQLQIRKKIKDSGYIPTPVINRDYFKSIYFREGSGVLFEIATHGPGFTIDEDPNQLGHSLKLPHMYEANRALIEAQLEPISLIDPDNFS